MNKPIGWRVGVTLAVLVGSIGAYWWRGHEALKKSPTAPPNPSMCDVLRNGLKLGLDLKGGIHLVLQVKTSDALRVEAQDTLEHLKDEGAKRGVAGPAGPGRRHGLHPDARREDGPAAKLKDLVKSILPPNSWSVDERGREWKIASRTSSGRAIEDQAIAAGRRDDPQPRRRARRRRARHPAAGHGPDRGRASRRRRPEPRQGDHRDDRPPRADARGRQGRPVHRRPRTRRRRTAGRSRKTSSLVEGFSEDGEARTRTPVFYVLKRAAAVTGRDLKNARVGRGQVQPARRRVLPERAGRREVRRRSPARTSTSASRSSSTTASSPPRTSTARSRRTASSRATSRPRRPTPSRSSCARAPCPPR